MIEYSTSGSNSFVSNDDGSYDADIDGVSNIRGGNFGKLNINGVCNSKGSINARDIKIRGVFTCKGDISTGHIDCSGVVTIEENLKAAHADIDGVVTVNGNRVEAEEIHCDGVLSCRGQISADLVRSDGFIHAGEIVGDRIEINSRRKSRIFQLWLKLKETVGAKDRSEVDLIEATTIVLRGVKAREVNGHDVTIGERCEIDKVSATGALNVDVTATIGEVLRGNQYNGAAAATGGAV